jgi:D-alanyl-D-alanine carboxypeptidase
VTTAVLHRSIGALVVLAVLVTAGVVPAWGQAVDGVTWAPAAPGGAPSVPPATARAYLLMDADTGQVLAERHAGDLLPVASTVKLLTTLTALETLDLDQRITVGAEVAVGGAGTGLHPGDTWTVAQLLDATIARSGNDAARALAVAAAGDLEAFAARMQLTADRLGLDGAVLDEPTGLADTNLLSARHLATIAAAALDHPGIRAAGSRRAVTLPGIGTIASRNLFLDQFPGATGLKTGFTELAGYCFVGSAERDGRELVAVVLGAREDPARFTEAGALLGMVFDRYVPTPLPPWRLRTAGGWVSAPPGIEHVWTPDDATVAIELAPPSGADGDVRAQVGWGGAVVVDLAARADARSSAPETVGARLMDAAYAAMRTAHRRQLWPAA